MSEKAKRASSPQKKPGRKPARNWPRLAAQFYNSDLGFRDFCRLKNLSCSSAAKHFTAKKRKELKYKNNDPLCKKGNSKKLNEEAKDFALYELAAFATHHEVTVALKEEYGIDITKQSIGYLERRNQELIEEYREEVLARMNTKLAYRVFRVERWAKIADEGRKEGDWKKEAAALIGIREEVGVIEGTQPSGTAKKAIEYVQAIVGGQGDPGCVQ